MSSKTIIFDFDGTLADSLVVLLEIYNELAEQKGIRPVTQADWLKLRQGTIKEGLKWTGIHPIQVPGMLTQGLKMLKSRTAEITLFPDVIDVVRKLHKEGYQLYVLSTNSEEVIREVLDKHRINNELEVLKSSRVFGKAQAIRKLVKTQQLEPSQVWMVGDEVRDMRAAKRAGVHAIAVSWGFQPVRTLQGVSKRVTVANSPSEIANIISSQTITNGT